MALKVLQFDLQHCNSYTWNSVFELNIPLIWSKNDKYYPQNNSINLQLLRVKTNVRKEKWKEFWLFERIVTIHQQEEWRAKKSELNSRDKNSSAKYPTGQTRNNGFQFARDPIVFATSSKSWRLRFW